MKLLVLVDSCIHIEARKHAPELLRVIFGTHPDYEFATCGMVEFEVMRGIKTPRAQAFARAQFALLRYLPTTHSTWACAREIAYDLDRRGVPIKPQDMIIAACAQEAGAAVFTRDRHFSEITGIGVLAHLHRAFPYGD